MNNLRYRTKTWLADNFKSAQYPKLERMNQPIKAPTPQLKGLDAVLMLMYAIVLLVVGTGLLIFGLFVLYVVLSSLF